MRNLLSLMVFLTISVLAHCSLLVYQIGNSDVSSKKVRVLLKAKEANPLIIKLISSHESERDERVNKISHNISKKSQLYKKNIVSAKLKGTFSPTYPRLALIKGLQGIVQLNLRVNKRGQVISAQIKKRSIFDQLNQSALKQAMKLEFIPAKENGWAVESDVKLSFNYSLKNTQSFTLQ